MDYAPSLSTQSRLLSSGADDFIEKGSAPEIMIARINTQLRHRLALERAEELALDMDLFTAGVLHDIRNIDAVIVSLIHLVKSHFESDPVKYREQILKDLDRLVAQTDRSANYAENVIQRVRESHKKPVQENIAIAPLVEWVKSNIASTNSHEIKIECPEQLVPVSCDQFLLRLVILNILQNAIKYHRPEAPTVVHITQTPDKERAGYIITKFRDNGVGVPDDKIRDIFKPFVRAVTIESEASSGFGLGLALVKRAMLRMNGYVWAEQSPEGCGPGLVICIALPVGK